MHPCLNNKERVNDLRYQKFVATWQTFTVAAKESDASLIKSELKGMSMGVTKIIDSFRPKECLDHIMYHWALFSNPPATPRKKHVQW